MKQPVIKPIKGPGFKYKLVKRFEIHLGFEHGWTCIKPGFSFDGASIPRWVWSVLGLTPAHPRILAGSLVHDFLYLHKELYLHSGWHVFTKKEADKIFDELNKQAGMDRVRRFLVYNAVKWFGRY